MSIRDFGPYQQPQLPKELHDFDSFRRIPAKKHPKLLSIIQQIGENTRNLTVAEREQITKKLTQIKRKLSGTQSEKKLVTEAMDKLGDALSRGEPVGRKRKRDETESESGRPQPLKKSRQEISTSTEEDLMELEEVTAEDLAVLDKRIHDLRSKVQSVFQEQQQVPLEEKKQPRRRQDIIAQGEAAVTGQRGPGSQQESPQELLPLIFELEYELRNIIALKDFPDKERYQQIYHQHVVPLLEKAKTFIKEHPLHYSVLAAANVGKAAVAGLQAIEALRETGREIQANVASSQEVTLLPALGVVFKRLTPKAKEESSLVDGIFHLMSPGAVVGTFDIKAEEREAKPFVPMVLFNYFQTNPQLLNKVLQRLSPNAEFNAVLTGEVQLLDLHSGNLGLAPVGAKECERYGDFKLPGFNRPVPLHTVVLEYLAGKINANTPISYTERTQIAGVELNPKVQTTVSKLPQELQNALNGPWELVIFDTDYALAEDNRLQFQERNYNKEHLIPLRSCLLESPWKDKPLGQETIDRLRNSDGRDLRVQQWIRRDDAPIYRYLSPEDKERVSKAIARALEFSSLSRHRQVPGQDMVTIEELRSVFAEHLSEKFPKMWDLLEKKLRVGLGDTYDLTSDAPEAVRRRTVVAAQLFPRVTLRQQRALLERQESRREYLQSYKALAGSKNVGTALIEEMKQFISRATSPLNTPRREALMSELHSLKPRAIDAISDFKKALCDECQPTYFNLMKAMYPLLADAYYLNEAAYTKGMAGKAVGYYIMPLEQAITLVRRSFPKGSPQQRVADLLQEKIDTTANPSYFGSFE